MPRKMIHDNCRQCGVAASEATPISTRGLCEHCGLGNHVASTIAIAGRSGDYYARWLAGMAAAVERRAAELGQGTGDVSGGPTASSDTAA